VLYRHDPLHPISDQPVLFVGRPGHQFHRRVFPHSELGPSTLVAIARDPMNGELSVVETTRNGDVYLWQARTSHVPFGHRQLLAHDTHADIVALAASHRRLWLSFNRHSLPFTGLIASRSPSGHLTALHRIGPHPGGAPCLATDPHSRHSSIWEADSPTIERKHALPTSGGVDLRHLTSGSIPRPTPYSTMKRDGVDAIGVDHIGRVHVEHSLPP
jgi:hypothetical protein